MLLYIYKLLLLKKQAKPLFISVWSTFCSGIWWLFFVHHLPSKLFIDGGCFVYSSGFSDRAVICLFRLFIGIGSNKYTQEDKGLIWADK